MLMESKIGPSALWCATVLDLYIYRYIYGIYTLKQAVLDTTMVPFTTLKMDSCLQACGVSKRKGPQKEPCGTTTHR